jgi:hypothetical protein
MCFFSQITNTIDLQLFTHPRKHFLNFNIILFTYLPFYCNNKYIFWLGKNKFDKQSHSVFVWLVRDGVINIKQLHI